MCIRISGVNDSCAPSAALSHNDAYIQKTCSHIAYENGYPA
jgi:hypothetical protein